ncbi:MAG: SGNH/GDSL hydrolase family protein [Candidatus Aphodocola sp.]
MKRRYKLLIGFIITGIILITIFFITRDKQIYYLSLGDSLAAGQTPNNTIEESYGDYVAEYLKDKEVLEFYTKKFSKSGYRSIDLLNDLNNNKKVKVDGKEITIKHALIKADIVTVSIGSNDLFYKLNVGNEFNMNEFDDIYTYVDEAISDVDKLLYELRKSCKEQIMVFGFYNPFTNFSSSLANTIEPVIVYANEKMKNLVKKYDMTYVDIHDMFLANDNYLPSKLEIHPTKDGYKAMAKSVINLIDKKTLAK